MTTTLIPPKRAQSAFSLIEIVVAVGIVATVMVALLGMIPTGLNTVNRAADTMAEIRIAQQILGEIQVSDFNSIEEWASSDIYYDRDGIQLEDNDPLLQKYTARVEIENGVTLPNKIKENDYCKRITVKISSKRGSVDFTDEAPLNEYRQFSTVSVMTENDNDNNNL